MRNWWRRDGHALVLEDLPPEHLVIGTGAHEQMRPDQDMAQRLKACGVTVESLLTGQAARRSEPEPLGRQPPWTGNR